MRTFAISDIHGCYQTFESLLQKIGLEKNDTLFLLGDYIDRGPGSKEVLDLILKLKEEQYNVQCILGNHEVMMLYALNHPHSQEAQSWELWNGGEDTLKSFSAKSVSDIDLRYLDFIRSMSYYIEKDQFIFVHAGLNFRIPDPFADKDKMVWAFENKPEQNLEWLGDRIVVHGHRIRTREQIKNNLKKLRKLKKFPVLGIDNGCVYQKSNYNHLCAIELSSMELNFHKNIDV